MSSGNRFLWGRLHSLTGIIPLGLFLMEHMLSNATAVFGSEAFDKQVSFLHSIPFVPLLEIVFIFLPLVYHAGYGIYMAYISKNNVLRYRYARNWMFFLQRGTGIVTLIFVCYHLWTLRFASLITGTEINFNTVSEHLSNLWIAIFYILGIVSTSFHFSNGLWTGLITWGITSGKASQRFSGRIAGIVFLTLSVLGISSVISFWTA